MPAQFGGLHALDQLQGGRRRMGQGQIVDKTVQGIAYRRCGAAQSGDTAVHVGILDLGQLHAEQRIVQRTAAVLQQTGHRLALDVIVGVPHGGRIDIVALQQGAWVGAEALHQA